MRSPSTDLGDGEVSRQGTDIALLRGYGDSTHLIWYRVTGDVRTGSPGVPDISHGCATGQQDGTASPTWSPDGTALAWEERNQQTGQSEIWVKRQAADCTVQPTASVDRRLGAGLGPGERRSRAARHGRR